MSRGRTIFIQTVLGLLLTMPVAAQQAATGLQLLQQLNDFPHASSMEFVEADVLDYDVGLGAMQKVGGAWNFKHSERFSGKLTSYTWQIVDGFTSLEVMAELLGQVEALEQAEMLFSCDGRACGQGVQWANRVFHEPVLYGREDLQRYRVFSLGLEGKNLLIVYASARTADRQYLHAQLLEIEP